MDDDLISIIVPVYNVEKYINRCIETIIKQDYKNIEILLIDDGSTDESGNICDEFEKKYSNIKVIHQKNQGLSKARNVGIKMSSGKYIGFVDSDDYIERDMYDVLHKNMLKYDADISVCDYIKIAENMKSCKKSNINSKTIIYDEMAPKMKELLTEENLNNYVWNKLYKRDLFDKNMFKEGAKFEDIDIMYKLFYEANRIVYTDYAAYNYVQRDNSIMKTIDNNAIADLIRATNERYLFIERNVKSIQKYNINRRIYTIYRYHSLLARKDDKKNYNSKKIVKEYEFLKSNYIQIHNQIQASIFEKILILILYIDRKIFYNIIKKAYYKKLYNNKNINNKGK